jgi:tryptophan synthase alpha chain
MGSLATAFAQARGEQRSVLVGYLPAGFPTVDGGIAVLEAMVEAGVDVIEVGFPYSDPLMDGPTIQAAAGRSLAQGTRASDVLRTVEAVAATGAPALVMTYWNPVERYGVEAFARDLAGVGGCGVITPDLIPDEAGDWIAATEQAGIDTVFLVAPSSTAERIARVAAVSTGFVYAASTMGVTGARASVDGVAADLVRRVRLATSGPVSVGLGVSTGAQAAEVAAYADGVIVGSAFVRLLLDADSTAVGAAAVGRLVGELAAGVRGKT